MVCMVSHTHTHTHTHTRSYAKGLEWRGGRRAEGGGAVNDFIFDTVIGHKSETERGPECSCGSNQQGS